ncbi:MAG: DUF4351 domain-containing protein [Planctomycetaceae bacterium]|nr:DUF4351 domain-containing protein [Planctomycetaceae bacterium]
MENIDKINLDNKTNIDNKVDDPATRKNNDWHCGFVGAMEVELRRAGCKFEINEEYKSVSRSYRVDMLITVKEFPPINSNSSSLAKYIRPFTLCEFKSPGVSLKSEDMDRLTLLSLQYYLENKDVNRTDMASILVVSHHPYELFKNLPDGRVVENPESGIYIIRYAEIFTVIMVIPELSEEVYKWLTSLKSNLTTKRLENLLNEAKYCIDDIALANLISVLLTINVNKIKKGELKMNQEFVELIENSPYAAPIFARREAKAAASAAANTEAKAIIRVLTKRLGKPSVQLQEQINKVNNIEKLDELIDFAATCVSLDEFATALN